MALTCKNCGGTVLLEENTLVCDSCGMRQQLSTVLSDNCDSYIFNNEELSRNTINTYKRALSMMASAKTENSFLMIADLFDEISGVLNADFLARECREKAELIKTEQIYNNALLNMQSDEPQKIEDAINAFKLLGDYKDSVEKSSECAILLSVAQVEFQQRLKKTEQQRLYEEKQQKLKARLKKIKVKVIVFSAIVLTLLIVVGYFFLYSSSNIKIALTPNENNFITEKFNSYVFNFNAKIENEGFIDVSRIEGNVIFEKDNEIIVDTNISFYNYSSAVVRAKKSSKFTWELTVYSYDTALLLYETDFEDLDIKIDITSITYTNGKTKRY